MNKFDKETLRSETVMYSAKLHWITYIGSVVIAMAAVFTFILQHWNAGIVFIVITCFKGVSSFVNYKNSKFILTDKRLIMRTGIFNKKFLDFMREEIKDIQINQSFLAKLVDYGEVTVIDRNDGKHPFSNIANPMEFRQQVMTLLGKAF